MYLIPTYCIEEEDEEEEERNENDRGKILAVFLFYNSTADEIIPQSDCRFAPRKPDQ